MTSEIDLLRSSIEENNQLYFCGRGRIEIKYLFSCLLQNNLIVVEMLFETQKPRLCLGFSISNNISSPRRLLCNKHDNACYISLFNSNVPLLFVMNISTLFLSNSRIPMDYSANNQLVLSYAL